MTLHSQPEIELHPAFAWDCEECGKEVFCRALVDDELTKAVNGVMGMAETLALEEEPTGGIALKVPTRVECPFCGSWFPCFPQEG